MFKAYTILFIAFSLNACTPNVEVAKQHYVDIPAFADQFVAQFGDQDYFSKQLLLNREEDKLKVKNSKALLRKELEALYSADINKAAFIGKYKVDSSFNAEGELVSVDYAAKEADLKVQSVRVGYSNLEIAEIAIDNRVDNLLVNSATHLFISSNGQFNIKGRQKINLARENKYFITCNF